MEYYLFFTYTMRLALRDGHSPWVAEQHEQDAFVALETELYHYAHHIFVSAAFVKQHLVADYGILPENITVVGMGVDDFYLRNMEAKVPERPAGTCLFVGFTFDLKGGPDVMKAFALARNGIPDLGLLIIGPHPSQRMRAPGVSAVGPVRDKEALLKHYRDADLLLLPSRCDSFGFVFLEAMTQGVVCIGSDLNAMPEIIEDGKTGFLVKPGDYQRMAELIVDFYRTPQGKKEMGERAKARVREHFTWQRVTEPMIQVMCT